VLSGGGDSVCDAGAMRAVQDAAEHRDPERAAELARTAVVGVALARYATPAVVDVLAPIFQRDLVGPLGD
jgi:hypothetical protein